MQRFDFTFSFLLRPRTASQSQLSTIQETTCRPTWQGLKYSTLKQTLRKTNEIRVEVITGLLIGEQSGRILRERGHLLVLFKFGLEFIYDVRILLCQVVFLQRIILEKEQTFTDNIAV